MRRPTMTLKATTLVSQLGWGDPAEADEDAPVY